MIKIQVRFFARASELTRTDSAEVELASSATVGDLKTQLGEQYPELQPILGHLFISVDEEFASDEIVLREDSRIACFPPVSGG